MKAAKLALGLVMSMFCLAQDEKPKNPDQVPKGETARADPAEPAIRASVAALVKAFDAGDAAALATLFSEDAELRPEDDSKIVGRDAIREHFAAMFADAPGAKLDVQIRSVRSMTPDVALEEGRAVITPASGSGDDPETTLYEAIHVRKDGKWLQARVRDFPAPDPTPHDRLKPLEWLLGEWVDEGPDAVVHSTCGWSEDGQFLLRNFRVTVQGKPEMTVTQRIGWDPVSSQIKGWVFDSIGGHAEQSWARDRSGRWIIKSYGVRPDGAKATSTNILARTGDHTATWISTDRTLGGEALDDIEEITLVRRPPAPK